MFGLHKDVKVRYIDKLRRDDMENLGLGGLYRRHQLYDLQGSPVLPGNRDEQSLMRRTQE